MRRAKIVCTLGPASSDSKVIGQLIDEGMNVARINFSHGDKDAHAAVIRSVRQEAERRGVAVAVLQDLQGPKIRVGRFANGSIELEVGQDFLVTTRAIVGDATQVSTTYAGLPRDVRPGDNLLLDDGLLTLEVIEVDGEDVHTRIAVGGTLKNNKGINLPGVQVSAPALTEKDIEDLRFGQKVGVDFVALSFVRSADDVRRARTLIAECGRSTPIIAKIERPEAVEHLDEIIDVADGIMVARGDLGVELGPEKVPLIQKRAIEDTNRKGKVVITATQMLESMIENQRPTRAEASDVANAVLDGTDALMLSGETASGRYPLLAVRTMARIIEEIESSQRWRTRMNEDQPLLLEFSFSTNAIAKGAVVAAQQVGAKVIAVVSNSGGAARFVSEYRPDARIVSFTNQPEVYRQLALYWGVEPLMTPPAAGFDELVEAVSSTLIDRGIAGRDELVVQTMAYPIGTGESTNTLHIHRLR